MGIDSHVQLSRLVIKEFKISETNGNTYVLDIPNNSIYEKGPSRIGIIKSYYDKSTEKYLSDKYETPMGQIIKELKDWEITDSANLLNEQQIKVISEFLTVLFVREPSLIDKTVEKTIFAKALGIKPTPSKFVRLLEKTTLVADFFNNHYPVVAFNKNERKFISSINGFYVWKDIFNDFNWWFPVTPTIAIHFVGNNFFEKVYECSSCIEVDAESVEQRNFKMYESAKKASNQYVFSNDYDALNTLIEK